ncbi:MAG: hypothetical protein PHQ03_10070 [Methylococcales bacterium]|nr:hypothetical protein [Methylococcales bacterium]
MQSFKAKGLNSFGGFSTDTGNLSNTGRFGLEATVRPSLAFYNTHDEVDHLVSTVRKIKAGASF